MGKRNESIEISLESLKNGAVAERFNDAIAKIVGNAIDQNTDHAFKRKVTIQLTMAPNEDRTLVDTKIDIKTVLAPPKVLKTVIAIGSLGDEYGAAEVGNQIVGQKAIDYNTGEVTEVGNKLIDMQKRAAGGN